MLLLLLAALSFLSKALALLLQQVEGDVGTLQQHQLSVGWGGVVGSCSTNTVAAKQWQRQSILSSEAGRKW